MRVALVHNTRAGDAMPPGELRRAIEEAGHEVAREIAKGGSLALEDEDGVELVAVAGGDGTLGDVARAFAGRGIPLAVLPLGTANNIATSLGIRGDPAELAKRWGRAGRVRFDFGTARGPWGQSLFLEGVGIGLIPAAITAAKQHGKKKLARGDAGPIEQARRIYERTLRKLEPSRIALVADGERLDGDYLLVQVLNISRVGPNLLLSPGADAGDGWLDLVLAGERERDALHAVLEGEGEKARGATLPVRRVRTVSLSEPGPLHVDDLVRETGASATIAISVAPASVQFLV